MYANDGGSKKPMRRAGARGRQEPRRESMRAPGKSREDDDEKNWTKKFEEGELDDLLVTGEEEGDDDTDAWFDDADDEDQAESR